MVSGESADSSFAKRSIETINRNDQSHHSPLTTSLAIPFQPTQFATAVDTALAPRSGIVTLLSRQDAKEGMMQPLRLQITWRQVGQLTLLLVALVNSGCLLATAGIAGGAVAGYAFCKGKVCGAYTASGDDTWAATRTALSELGMPILKEERKGSEGFIESRTADGERIKIYLQSDLSKIPAEGQITYVCVRIAVFGDQPVSERILDQVGLHLAPVPWSGGTPPPPAALGTMQTGGSPSSAPANLPPATGPPPLLPPEPQSVPNRQ
jgi:hypothetical protein